MTYNELRLYVNSNDSVFQKADNNILDDTGRELKDLYMNLSLDTLLYDPETMLQIVKTKAYYRMDTLPGQLHKNVFISYLQDVIKKRGETSV